jgi:hypothetical protein
MRVLLTVAAAAAVAVLPAAAQDWNEIGEAGDLVGTANVTIGSGPLIEINGVIEAGGDADMFCITVTDEDTFSATTVGGTTLDTQLWLFDHDGMGIAFNDDDPGGAGLQSTVTGMFISAPGTYYIAVSTYDWDAIDAAGSALWEDAPWNVERAPDGPGAANPVASWGGSTAHSGPYTITLTSAGFCSGSPVEATSWGTIKALYR